MTAQQRLQVGRIIVEWEDGTRFVAEKVRGAAVDIEPEYSPSQEIRTGDEQVVSRVDPMITGFAVRVSGSALPGPDCFRYEYPEGGPEL